MKQRIVVKVQMTCAKCRTKALKIAASVYGVSEVKLEGDEKDQVAVVGENVDSASLTRKLKKKIGYATIVSVTIIEEPAAPPAVEEKKDDTTTSLDIIAPSRYYSYPWYPISHYEIW